MASQPRISTCQVCLTPDVEVFYTQREGWVCEGCRDKPRLKTLSRHERHQRAADAGFDTWDDYNGDR